MTPSILDHETKPEPMTPMERHVLELSEHLRKGVDTRAGFYTAIDCAMQHAKWLEKRSAELEKRVEQLELALCPSLPKLNIVSELFSTTAAFVFNWQMESLHFRSMWWHRDRITPKEAINIRRRTYRQLLRLFRQGFEKTWNDNIGHGIEPNLYLPVRRVVA